MVLAGAALAQTESQIESDEVRRVGSHLNCQCGGCDDNLNCMMSAGQCPYCRPARKKIFTMQLGGMNDSSIIASFVRQVGDEVVRKDPSPLFRLVPWLSLAGGALWIVLILTKMRNRRRTQTANSLAASGPSGDDENLLPYLDMIRKSLPE